MAFRFQNRERFSLSQSLSGDLVEHLTELVEGWGGALSNGPDESQYHLIDPRVQEEYAVPDDEVEHAICYTFLRACIEGARCLIPVSEADDLWPVFVHEDGTPLEVYLHENIGKREKRLLREMITRAGGARAGSSFDCDVILVDEAAGDNELRKLRRKHVTDPYTRVHPISWLHECLDARELLPEQSSSRIPGRRIGTKPVPFTTEDDRHLVRVIAKLVPFSETGGRSGVNIYRQICDRSNEDEFPWANRHPWQSWQNRYKKRREEFDISIEEYLDRHPMLRERWDASQSHNKRAARRLGLDPNEGFISPSKAIDEDEPTEEEENEEAHTEEEGGEPEDSAPSEESETSLAQVATTRLKTSTNARRQTTMEADEPDEEDERDEENEVDAELAPVHVSTTPSIAPSSESSRSTSESPEPPQRSGPPRRKTRPLSQEHVGQELHERSNASPKTRRQAKGVGGPKKAKQPGSSNDVEDNLFDDFGAIRDAPSDAPVPKWASGTGRKPKG